MGTALLTAVLLSAGCDEEVDAARVLPDAAVAADGAVSSDANASPDTSATVDGNTTATSVTKSIGASGGSIGLGNLVLSIPPGALATDKTIVVTATNAAAPAGFTLYSPIYKFEPEGLTFDKPVTVAITFTAGAVDPSLFWSQMSGSGYDDLKGVVSGSTMSGSVSHFSTGFVGRLTPVSDAGTDASPSDAGTDSAIPDDGSTGTDAAADASATDAGADAAPVDAGDDSAAQDAGGDSAVADASSDGPLSCVAFSPTAPLVELVNVATAMPSFTGGTITPGIYHLLQAITYTGPGGATGKTQGVYAQTQKWSDTAWEGIVSIPSSSTLGSFSATYTANGAALTFTKACGNLQATGSNYTVVTPTIMHLQNGASGVQVLELQ